MQEDLDTANKVTKYATMRLVSRLCTCAYGCITETVLKLPTYTLNA